MDVTTTAEAGLQDASDEQQFAYLQATGRVIFTYDDHFLRFHRSDDQHPGIVYCKHGTQTIGEVIRFQQPVSDCLAPVDIRGRIEYF